MEDVEHGRGRTTIFAAVWHGGDGMVASVSLCNCDSNKWYQGCVAFLA